MKRKRVKKITQSLVVLLLVVATFTLLPETKAKVDAASSSGLMFADTGLVAISNPTNDADLTNQWQGDYLYWGKEPGSNNPMKWQVLNKNSTEFGNTGILILSSSIGETNFSDTPLTDDAGIPIPVDPDNNVYVGSTLDTYINAQYSSRMSDGEKNATFASSNNNELEYAGFGSFTVKDQCFTNRKWFAPTGLMMQTGAYGFATNSLAEDKARLTNANATFTWLSSRRTDSSERQKSAGGVYSNTSLTAFVTRNRGVYARAASTIDTNSLLFVSAANGGKTGNSTATTELVTTGTGTVGEWKFTLKDTTQSITKQTVKRTALDTLEITLDKVGKGTSISAIVTDASGAITNYSRVKTVSSGPVSDAKVTITLPDSIINGTNKLKIFTEEYNGETATDYASALYDITVPTEITPPVLVGSINISSTDDKVSIQEGETIQMVADVVPNDADNKEVTWSVSNKARTTEQLATISATGLLTGVTEGEVVVTATANDTSGVVGTKQIAIVKKGSVTTPEVPPSGGVTPDPEVPPSGGVAPDPEKPPLKNPESNVIPPKDSMSVGKPLAPTNTISKPTNRKIIDTGDYTNIWQWVSMLSVVSIIFVCTLKKVRQDN